MADKYIDTSGAASGGLNDGTSQANAWTDFRDVFSGAFSTSSGQLDPGDVVHIRSHDGTSNVEIDLTSAGLTSNIAGTAAAPITWLVDDGTKWAQGGKLTIKGSGAYSYNIRDYNVLDGGDNRNLVMSVVPASYATAWYLVAVTNGAWIVFRGAEFTTTVVESHCAIYVASNRVIGRFENCLFNNQATVNTSNGMVNVNSNDGVSVSFKDCDFNGALLGSAASDYAAVMLGMWGGTVTFDSCRLINTTSDRQMIRKVSNFSTTGADRTSRIFAINCDWGLGSLMADAAIDLYNASNFQCDYDSVEELRILGKTSWRSFSAVGEIKWDEDGIYPALNAILPNSANTKWSIRAAPSQATSFYTPLRIVDLNKFWNGAQGQVVVTANLLVKDTSGGSGAFDNIKNKHCFIEISYRDSTGVVRKEFSARDETALPTANSAAWTATSYGGIAYSRHAVSLTTAHSVQADSLITVSLNFALPTSESSDFFFACPDIQLAAA